MRFLMPPFAFALTITAIVSLTSAQTFTLTCYDGTNCSNEAITDCEGFNSGECCNCATDDQGDPLDPSNAVESLTRRRERSASGHFILTGVVGVYNMDPQKRSLCADDAVGPEPRRNYLASEPTTDGNMIVYRLRMGTEKAKAYKALPRQERRQFIIDNYDEKIVRPPFNSHPA
ncbi:uncharacterized protein PAN0_016d5389 [Moesziomyces antarcticus]|uniref:Uncharacterized protein n=2 Tax=Pseudozyma antarctica TaxID=84753 RepID=A0A5C3FW29_PSEA2|nr:uncharacterized protein PAN0_016d5389 [Moesziomyces antarcticus]GAK67163.1 hypothetical protein PAN0_016d5389 [Moesziomyces antarcticus]SPO48420.1 uncharacterized protein PSANT_06111 [Moesziomyces antarcticus]